MITINIRDKELNASKILEWIVEDERNKEDIVFTLSDESLTGLNYYLLYRNAEDKGGYERLEKTVNGANISLLWTPSHNFTQTEGAMLIQIVGFEFEEDTEWHVKARWSTKYASITIQPNIEAEELAPDVTWDLAEHYLSLIEADIATYSGIKEDMDETFSSFSEDYTDFVEDYSDFSTKYADFDSKYDEIKNRMLKATLRRGQDNRYSVLQLENVIIGD